MVSRYRLDHAGHSRCAGCGGLRAGHKGKGVSIMVIPSNRAWLCLDCRTISTFSTYCPACASREVWPVDAWLGREATLPQSSIPREEQLTSSLIYRWPS